MGLGSVRIQQLSIYQICLNHLICICTMFISRGMLTRKELGTKLNTRIIYLLCNTVEKRWILICLNYVYDLDHITQLSLYKFLKIDLETKLGCSECIWNFIRNMGKVTQKADKNLYSVWMSHYRSGPLASSSSRDHLSNPIRYTSELSGQGTTQLGYLFTDTFLSPFGSCPLAFRTVVRMNGKVLQVGSCQLQVNSVVGSVDVE